MTSPLIPPDIEPYLQYREVDCLISSELHERLVLVAEEHALTKSALLRKIITEYIDKERPR
jgi:predicted DNA-binding protein